MIRATRHLVGTDDTTSRARYRAADRGVDWFGKANPRVQMPKKEPQNRRVEIET
jgi:hypothetical protein